MRLVIAEKPSLARTIADALGKAGQKEGFIETKNGDRVSWLFGHFYEFADPDAYLPRPPNEERGKRSRWRAEDLPIVPRTWKRVLKDDAGVKRQHRILLGLMKEADVIINAGDPDREGQLLVDEWLEEAGNRKPVLRVWLKDLTPEGIRRAFAEAKDNATMRPLYESALARARADWLIGMNATRAMTIAQGGKLLSVGRVQTPTLALIVGRERAIETFVPKKYFELRVRFVCETGIYEGRWDPPRDVLDAEGYLLDRAVAQKCLDRVSAAGRGIAEKVEVERKNEPAPLPFALSDLQKRLSQRYGFGAQETLDTVQKLYEEGLVTYPRTDCTYLEGARHAEGAQILAMLAQSGFADLLRGTDPARRSRAFDDSKVGAHTAIVPTKKAPGANLTGKLKTVYEEIVRRYVAQFLPDAVVERTRIRTRVGEDVFITTGTRLVSPGWRSVYGGEDKEEEKLSACPKEGEQVGVKDARIEPLETKPPKRFTEGTLIEAMRHAARFIEDEALRKVLRDTDGIGTEATRAAIIETLKRRGFIEVKKKEIVPTPLGRFVVEVVPKELASVDLTAYWERMLSDIGRGALALGEFERAQEAFVRTLVSEVLAQRGKMNTVSSGGKGMETESLGQCPVCHEGEIIESSKGFGCSRWREGCKFTVWKEISGRKFSPKDVKIIIDAVAQQRQTPVFSGFVSKKSGKEFSAALAWDESQNRLAFKFEGGDR